MTEATRLLFPALRWNASSGFEQARPDIESALQLGVGGFILFGGEAEAVQALTAELRQRSRHPLLIAADLERGAGQQFTGATPLPPLAALGYLDDEQLTERAGAVTAREARALGVDWIYAPVADIDLEAHNPIVGTRAFGREAKLVSRHVSAWIRGCHLGGALACAKHFPGHGRTAADSHSELPEVTVDAGSLEQDLIPFRAAIKTGVDSIMTAHVRYLAFDASGAAGTLSARIVTGLLRERLGFEGLIVTDALNMQGVVESAGGEERAAVLALEAGCDCLLYPTDARAIAAALAGAADRLPVSRVNESVARLDRAAQSVTATPPPQWGRAADRDWAVELAQRAIHWVRGQAHIRDPLQLMIVDDDRGGPFPAPSRHPFVEQLHRGGVTVEPVVRPDPHCVVAVFCDTRAWKQRSGLSAENVARVDAAVDAGADLIVLFAHPRIAGQFRGANVLCAWGGEPLMQEAAARRLLALRQQAYG